MDWGLPVGRQKEKLKVGRPGDHVIIRADPGIKYRY